MRRLTLILSDLYLPEEAGRGAAVPTMHDLPNLEWLLRFADSPERIADWRHWLPGPLESNWRATPVALEARLDHVRLLDRGLLRLDAIERASCREEFASVFGPQFQLHDGGERTFFLSGLPTAGVHVTDPARLLGTEIGPALPGREAGELRRLWTEIEMWLHGAAFNSVRERAGRRRVSALWLWRAASTPSPRERVEPWDANAAFLGGDPMLAEYNRHPGGPARGVPKQFADIDSDAPHVVVEFAPLTGGPHESLESLDANWFAPVKSALVTGDIREVELVANDRWFRINVRPQWKIWRRRHPWLARLAS